MSLSLLLEKYDVSTEEGLQKAFNEIAKEEAEVDEALAGILSRSCTLEGELRTTSQAYTKLGELKTDGQSVADMVSKTAELARDVSAKVRQLDLARSRVAECQHRVHDLIDLQLCSEGVEAAIKAHDYETGAAHVARFLSMDPGSLAAARARGAPDPRDSMRRAAHTLRESLVRKFEEAARKEDDVAVERLFKLFPQIGRADEGIDLLAKYLAIQTESSIRRASIVTDVTPTAAVYADAFTRVLEAAGASIERARNMASTAAPGLLPRAIAIIQPVVCIGARRLYNEMRTARRLDTQQPQRALASVLEAEPILAELALAHSRLQLYCAFLRRKVETDASTLSDAGRKQCSDAVERIIKECDLTRTAQDLIDHYLSFERYFLENSVSKAIRMSNPAAGATASSLVDDVFFVARKVIRRSLSSGSVDGACAMLNEVATQLECEVANTLRRFLRSSPPDPLPLPPPRTTPSPLDAAGLLTQRLNRDVDAQRTLFLNHLTEAEIGAEWSERLAAEACAEAEPLFRCVSDRYKVQSCASGLSSAATAFRTAHDVALAGIMAALKPRVVAWAEAIADPGIDNEELDDDADALPSALDVFVDFARGHLEPRSVDALLVALISDITTRAERRILHHHYNREGGLLVERRARRLASWAGGNACAARERCARLTQAAALLALERAAHATEALRAHARLAPNDAREILTRRTDFKMEDIKRLKL